MDFKKHLIIGSLLVVILTAILYFTTDLIVLDTKTLLFLVIIAYVFPILPDIDHRISTITWNFLGIGIAGVVISIVNTYYHFINIGTPLIITSVILLLLTFVCARFAGHRGIIHTIKVGAMFAAASWFLTNDFVLCAIAFAAYYSHLVADGLWDKL
jgi:hypothetical protein